MSSFLSPLSAQSPSASSYGLDVDVVFAIVDQVWSSYGQAEQELMQLADFPAQAQASQESTAAHAGQLPGEQISASVAVTGAFMGHVVVATSQEAAQQITGIALDDTSQQVSDDDVADWMGELANVIGGNIKSLLPGPSVLSLPMVMTSTQGQAMHWPDAYVALHLPLGWRGQSITVTVWARKQETSDAQ